MDPVERRLDIKIVSMDKLEAKTKRINLEFGNLEA